MMKNTNYEAPSIEVIEVQIEGAILSNSIEIDDMTRGVTW